MKINQMKKDQLFEGFYLIKSAEVRKTRAGKDFINLTFQDDTGEISGNLWDAQPYNVEEFTAGKIVFMKGRREVYNGTLRLIKSPYEMFAQGSPMIQKTSKKRHLSV